MTISVTTEFREEFEAERLHWLRRRFLWYTGVVGGLGVLDVIGSTIATFIGFGGEYPAWIPWVLIALSALAAGAYAVAFLFALRTRKPLTRATLIKLVFALILVNGMAHLPESVLWTRLGEARAGALAAQQDAAASQAEAPAGEPGSQASEGSTEPETRAGGPDARQPAPTPGEPETDAESSNARVSVAPGSRFQITTADEEGRQVDAVGPAASWMFSVFITHLFASLFIPWTPRESVRPLAPLLILNALLILLLDPGTLLTKIIWIAVSPLVGVPGVAIAWWRHSRFRRSFSHKVLRRSYGEMKRELVDARRIHESLFPAPIDDGPVRFAYLYEPMRQIGGDFLFAQCAELPDKELPLLNVVVIDVTGHGITAALTVNRLAGEIEREFGEKPDAEPGEILHGLNAYLHHTLARHSVYATALCVRIDPNTDELIWASAGHPPAFLRMASGRLDRLDSTSLLLGACRADDFYPNQQKMPFHAGDSVLIYTDGATEARNHDGAMLRTDGMQKLVASIDPRANGSGGGAGGSWCESVLDAIDRFRHGPAQDDTLIVEIARPFSS